MSDRVIFQSDDALSEKNLSQQRARKNSTDYVERGLDITGDFTNDELDVSAGHAVIKDGVNAYDVFPDARANKALADAAGVNYVWLVVDTANQDAVSVEINATGSAPSSASLLIAEVDAGAETVSHESQAPDATYKHLAAETTDAEREFLEDTLTAGHTLDDFAFGTVHGQDMASWSRNMRRTVATYPQRDKPVVIFRSEGAHTEEYNEFYPRMKERGLPFTIGVGDRVFADGYLSVEQVEEMMLHGGEIALYTGAIHDLDGDGLPDEDGNILSAEDLNDLLRMVHDQKRRLEEAGFPITLCSARDGYAIPFSETDAAH